MRLALAALAWPKKNAATILITSPMKVRTLGEMRGRARPYTIRSKSQPHARPKALVQVILSSYLLLRAVFGVVIVFSGCGFVLNGRQFQNLKLPLAVWRHDSCGVAYLLADQAAPDWRSG